MSVAQINAYDIWSHKYLDFTDWNYYHCSALEVTDDISSTLKYSLGQAYSSVVEYLHRMDVVLGSPQNLKKGKYTSLLKHILNWCLCVSAQTNAGACKD